MHTIIVIVRRGLLSFLISRLPQKEISSIAEYIAKNETKDFVLLLRNKYNIESALDVIETWIKISGYPYRHEVNYIQQDAGNVDAIEGNTVVITSEGDRQEYNVPKSEIEGYNGALLLLVFPSSCKYHVYSDNNWM